MLNETYRAMLGNKSVIRETFMYGKQRAAEIGYENVFDYSLGNPSVPCPQEFTAAMQDLLTNEEPVNLHGYCPSQGDPGFRTDVAATRCSPLRPTSRSTALMWRAPGQSSRWCRRRHRPSSPIWTHSSR